MKTIRTVCAIVPTSLVALLSLPLWAESAPEPAAGDVAEAVAEENEEEGEETESCDPGEPGKNCRCSGTLWCTSKVVGPMRDVDYRCQLQRSVEAKATCTDLYFAIAHGCKVKADKTRGYGLDTWSCSDISPKGQQKTFHCTAF